MAGPHARMSSEQGHLLQPDSAGQCGHSRPSPWGSVLHTAHPMKLTTPSILTGHGQDEVSKSV